MVAVNTTVIIIISYKKVIHILIKIHQLGNKIEYNSK